MKYLFSEWQAIKDKISKKHLFIFLDFDGTLAPIASTPDKAVLPKEVKGLLKRLVRNPRLKLAFTSGRALKDIKNKIGLKSVIYSGNHGLEIEGPRVNFKQVVSARYKSALERIKNNLKKKINSIDGAFIEDKGLTLTLHYRLVQKSQIPLVKAIFQDTVILYLARNLIRVSQGKMVLEVGPLVEWDKGKVVLWLLSRQVFALKKENMLSIYLGDDATDEDAFRALKNNGLTVFVGKHKISRAKYYLKNQFEVAEFLERIYKIYHE